MSLRVLVDTGPLVAILSSRDQHHRACVDQLRELAPPLLTCWPVITEAAWLLRGHPRGLDRLLGSFDAGLLKLLPLGEEAMPWVCQFLRRYRQQGAQLADAALVYLAGREGIDTVFTLDRRDFSSYRLPAGRRVSLVPAW
jgi:predicted nucleic acid-binding protein